MLLITNNDWIQGVFVKYYFIAAFFSALLVACTSPQPTTTDENNDKLTVINDNHYQQLSIKSGFSLTNYSQLIIEAPTVSYPKKRRNELPNLHPEDFQFDAKELARFQQQYQNGFKEGFTLKANNNEHRSLIIRSKITELYLTAPIKLNIITPYKTLVNETSTLIIETDLIDASTQQLVATVKDRIKTGQNYTHIKDMETMNSVMYWQDVYQAFRRWGRQFQNTLNNQ